MATKKRTTKRRDRGAPSKRRSESKSSRSKKRNPTKAALLRKLRKRKGVRSPEGLAAYIGRKTHGTGSMAAKSGAARRGKKRGTYKKRG